MQHVARILASPLTGVYSTHIDSAQQFGRHWHDTYGFGFLEHGAQEWFSGRGVVRGYPGEVIATNPGEVHDGRPLGPPTRRWRIAYVDVDVMTTLTASERGAGGHAEITRPVIQDAMLFRILQRLFSRLERWNNRTPQTQPVDSLAFEEALVASCVRLMARHGAARWRDAPSSDLQQVRERLADDAARVPSLADLAQLTGLSRYQVLRRFERAYGLPPHAWLLRRRAGAQTVSLARNSPGAQIVAFDHATASLARAMERVAAAGLSNVEFLHADLHALPFDAESFDHVFICFVLEHLSNPIAALQLVKRLLKLGGTVTIFEGDHGSAYFHPDSEIAHRAIACQVELQRRAGGNACIGRQLYPLLVQAGYEAPCVTPRVVYVDATTPDLVDSFTRKTFTWMVAAVREEALAARIIDAATFDAGIRDLYRAAEPDGVFCYTFFKGVAAKPAHLPREGGLQWP